MSYGKLAQLPPLTVNERLGAPCESCGVETTPAANGKVVSGATCSRCVVQGPVRSRKAIRAALRKAR